MKRKKKNKKAEKEFNQALWNNLKEQHTKSEADEALLESLKIIEDFIIICKLLRCILYDL